MIFRQVVVNRSVAVLVAAVAVSFAPLNRIHATTSALSHASKGPKVVHQTVELVAPDGAAEDGLGVSVASSGATIVAGDINGNAAYVWEKPKAGWGHAAHPIATLTPSDAGGQFGISVAIDANTIVVGSPFHAGMTGALYVFVKPKGGWVDAHENAQLTVSGAAGFDVLGEAAAVSGDTVVGGAPNHEVGRNVDAGAAYVYAEPKHGWVTTSHPNATLTATGDGAHARFANALSLSGSTLAVGAPGQRAGSKAAEGAAYVFLRPAHGWSGTRHQREELRASDGTTNTALGISVAAHGTTVVVGAGNDDPYVFNKPKPGWSGTRHQSAELTSTTAAPSDFFGASVALSGRTMVTGAPLDQVGPNPSSGAAYTFTRHGSTWKTSAHPGLELAAKHGSSFDDFGQEVTVSSGLIVVGAHGHAIGANSEQGAIYVYAAPTLSSVRESHKSWKPGSTLPRLNPAHRPSTRGTVFRFGLDQLGIVQLSFARKADGRFHQVATLHETAPAGHDRLFFDGRLTHAKKLPAGHYLVTTSARSPIGRSSGKTLHFTIRKT